MARPTMKKSFAHLATLGLTAAMVTIPTMATASAADGTSSDISYECVDYSKALGKQFNPEFGDGAFTTNAPATVAPGQTFSVTVQPGRMATNVDGDTARMKYDIALPTNAEISNVRIASNAAGSGFTEEPTAVVERVNENGEPDEEGNFARVWDGEHSVNNGGDENDRWGTSLNKRAGLAVDRDTVFQFPGVTFDVTAPDTVGATITTGLRGAGEGPGEADQENVDNTLSFLTKRTTGNRAVFCTADENGKTLTETTVKKNAPGNPDNPTDPTNPGSSDSSSSSGNLLGSSGLGDLDGSGSSSSGDLFGSLG